MERRSPPSRWSMCICRRPMCRQLVLPRHTRPNREHDLLLHQLNLDRRVLHNHADAPFRGRGQIVAPRRRRDLLPSVRALLSQETVIICLSIGA